MPYIVGAVTGQNQSAVDLVENIQANILCNDCLFGAFDLINVALPTLGNLTLSQLSSVVSGSMAGNSTDPTLVQIVDGECAYVPLAVTSGESGGLPGLANPRRRHAPFQHLGLDRQLDLPLPSGLGQHHRPAHHAAPGQHDGSAQPAGPR